MLLFITAQLVLAAPAGGAPIPGSSSIYSYRGADGSEHFVGRIEDVPPAQQAQAHQVDLGGWSSNRSLAEGIKRAKEDEIRRMTPSIVERAESKLQGAAEARRLHPGKLTESSWFPIAAVAILLLAVQASFFAWVIFNRPRAGWLLIPTFLAVVAAVGCGFYLWSRPGGGFPQELDPLEAATNARRVRDEVNKIQQQRDQEYERAFNPPEAQRSVGAGQTPKAAAPP